MPSKHQVSLSLSSPAARVVRQRMRRTNPNKSRIVSQIIERYAGILRVSPLELTEDELEHLRRLTAGWELNFTTAMGLAGVVEAADVPEDLSVIKGKLLDKLSEWGPVTATHAIEMLEAKR